MRRRPEASSPGLRCLFAAEFIDQRRYSGAVLQRGVEAELKCWHPPHAKLSSELLLHPAGRTRQAFKDPGAVSFLAEVRNVNHCVAKVGRDDNFRNSDQPMGHKRVLEVVLDQQRQLFPEEVSDSFRPAAHTRTRLVDPFLVRGLDYVARGEVVESTHRDAALVTCLDLADVVFDPAKAVDLALAYFLSVPEDAGG